MGIFFVGWCALHSTDAPKSCALIPLRKSLLKFLLQEPVESIDYWAREENAALGWKIDRLSSNVLLCFISFYFTVFVFLHFYGNLPTTTYSGKPMYSILDTLNLCMLVLIFFVIHSAVLADVKLFREQNKRYRFNIVLFSVVWFCGWFIMRNIHVTFFPSSSCC